MLFFCYGVVPKGLLTFFGFLVNAEFSPWEKLPVSMKKFAGVFVTASDVFLLLFVLFCLEKKICAIPVRVMKDQN